jgi:hypothetical protein
MKYSIVVFAISLWLLCGLNAVSAADDDDSYYEDELPTSIIEHGLTEYNESAITLPRLPHPEMMEATLDIQRSLWNFLDHLCGNLGVPMSRFEIVNF